MAVSCRSASFKPFYDVKMTRHGLLLLVIASALPGGCRSDIQMPPALSGTMTEQPITPDEAHCRAVAAERADDAHANGYGFEVEQSVNQETYRDCMTWRARKPE